MAEEVKLGDTIRGTFGTTKATTGAAQNDDATPTCVVLEQGTAMGYAPTCTNKATGLYEVAIDCTTGNGFEVGKEYSSYVVVLVDGITRRGPVPGVSSFTIRANSRDDIATAANLSTAQTAITAIKGKTDSLTFTVALQADVNVLDWKSATAPAMTGDAFARLGAPAGASVSADVAAAKVDTAAIKLKTDSLTFTTSNKVDTDAMVRLGAPAGASVSADIAAVKVDTAAISTKTTNLPSDPADASDVAGAFSTVNATLATIAGYIDTEVAAILAAVDTEVGSIKTTVEALPSAATIATAVADKAIDGTKTIRGVLARMDAVNKGKATGLKGTNPKFYADDDTTALIDAVQDVDLGTREPATVAGD